MNPARLTKIPISLLNSLNDSQITIGLISAKLKSLGLLLCGQSKETTEHEALLPGIGIILEDLGNDLEIIADRLDPVELGKLHQNRKRPK